MAVYVIVDLDVKDTASFEPYRNAVPAVVAKHGGEYLARGGRTDVIEGDWQPGRLVLFRFPDKGSVEAFFDDPEYRPLKELRQRVSSADIVMVEGMTR
jgi:uncharacterized protein (DUF1330 family)